METLKASAPGLAKIKQARKEKGWSVDSLKWLEEASIMLGSHGKRLAILLRGFPKELGSDF
jgi:hypothetical protein